VGGGEVREVPYEKAVSKKLAMMLQPRKDGGKPKRDLTNRRFGRLVVVTYLGVLKKGRQYYNVWRCLCECGAEVDLLGVNLTKGGTQSCGCYRRDRAEQLGKKFGGMLKKPGTAAALNMLYGHYRHGAEIRGLAFDLSPEEFRKVVDRNCHYCGSPPTNRVSKRKGTYKYNGIDRVDNAVGYVFANCVASCIRCNRAKMGSTKEQFIAWIHQLARFHSESVSG
jgi:hypothetical protein